MNKFLKVFISQGFNSFFPIVIVSILALLVAPADAATVILVLNFANIYLLFSDYSANIVFFKDAIDLGGISPNRVAPQIVNNIQAYIGVKTVVLAAGFVLWIPLCYIIPQLRLHAFSNILAYAFIIGNNFNFYWIYMSSKKEYFFILSNFASRLFFVLILIMFITLQLSFFWLLAVSGLGALLINWLIFTRFCSVHRIHFNLSAGTLQTGVNVIKRDWALVANSVMIMTPTNCLSLFIGFVKNSSHIIIYALAEKIFFIMRTLLSVFVNSIYPMICRVGSVHHQRARRMFSLLYTLVALACAAIYFIAPQIFLWLKQPPAYLDLFSGCLLLMLLTIGIIAINTRFFLELLVTNQLNHSKNFKWLSAAAAATVGTFIISLVAGNSVFAIARALLISEAIILMVFYWLSRQTIVLAKPAETT